MTIFPPTHMSGEPDLRGLLGDDGYLHAGQRCARLLFVTGMTTEIAALYHY